MDISPPTLAAWLRVARDAAGGKPFAGEAQVSTEPLGDDALPAGILTWEQRVELMTAGPQVRQSGRRKVVDFGDGNVAPYSGRFTASEGLPFPVVVHYRWSEPARQFIIHKVVCESDDGVTGEGLRAVPLDRLLTNHLVVTSARRAARISHESHKDQELVEVATIYTAAFARRRPPVMAVAEALGVSRSTANKRVIAARKAGLLPPTTQGKAGA